MNTDLIEKLKKNTICHAFLSDEERACFEEVGIENCNIICGHICGHIHTNWSDCNAGDIFLLWRTYRIKPSYQPEPKEKRLEVLHTCNILHAISGEEDITLSQWLNKLEFIAFEYEGTIPWDLAETSEKIHVEKYGSSRTTLLRLPRPDGRPALIPKYVIIKDNGND